MSENEIMDRNFVKCARCNEYNHHATCDYCGYAFEDIFKCRNCGEKYDNAFTSDRDQSICRWCSGEEDKITESDLENKGEEDEHIISLIVRKKDDLSKELKSGGVTNDVFHKDKLLSQIKTLNSIMKNIQPIAVFDWEKEYKWSEIEEIVKKNNWSITEILDEENQLEINNCSDGDGENFAWFDRITDGCCECMFILSSLDYMTVKREKY